MDKLIKVKSYLEMLDCIEIRVSVFMIEQKVEIMDEIDGKDKQAEHYLFFHDEKAVGTIRVFLNNDKKNIHLGRVAILKEYRHQGLGSKMLDIFLSKMREAYKGYNLNLDSQEHAISFYEKFGFKITDQNSFLDANIPHKHMGIKL